MTTQRAQADFLDMFDPGFNTYSDLVRRAQERHWYARGSAADYVVLRYAEVSALLRESRLHQITHTVLSGNGIVDGPLVEWWNFFLLNLAGEQHARLRRLLSKAFTPPAVARLRPFMRATAGALIDAMASRGSCDFVSAFADPYPLAVISELLGIPVAQRDRFRGWANDIALMFGTEIVAKRKRIETAVVALTACVDELLPERRRTPGSDLISTLLAVEESGDRLTSQELRMLVVSLVFAGNDTTRNQLAVGMYAFLQHPEQWSLLAEHPELASGATDEIVRVYPAVPGAGRIVGEDFEYQGLRLRAGARVYLMLGAANRDPAVFGEHSDFDIRVRERPRVLSFGSGIHHCLGSWLARAEIEEALPMLAHRFRAPQLTAEPSWRTFGITGPRSLPIRFSATE